MKQAGIKTSSILVRGAVLNMILYGEALPRGPTPLSVLTEKVPRSFTFY